MTASSRLRTLLLALAAVLVLAAPAGAQQLRVLVTNDDGVGAPGLDALVSELTQNSGLDVSVVAPATNQSGTGDTITTTPITVSPGATASGFPASAVTGRPADTVLLAVRELLAQPPEVVVSGINSGQNVSREIVNISGTVGAALTAARLGIPAIAVSQGLGATSAPQFADAARYAAILVEDLRRGGRLSRRMLARTGRDHALLLNVNFPTCTAGERRGVRVVPLAQLTTVASYNLTGTSGSSQTFQAVLQNLNPFAVDCTSALLGPATDVEALTNGFASVTPLNPDLTVDSSLRLFRPLERVRF